MATRYPAWINTDDGKTWGLSFVDLPIHIIGDSVENCVADAQEAFEEFLEDEKVLPKPSTLNEVKAHGEWGKNDGVLLVEIDTAFFSDPVQKRTLSARKSQWEAIDKKAKQAGKTRSAFIVEATLSCSA